jgi:hypothetical protein
MEWRCEWCGKPHEEDNPPCDNCGHGKFEKAVVQQTDLGADGPETTTVWVCTECGREHTKHSPPCSRCGNAKLEKQESRVDDSELSAPGYTDLLTPQYAVALAVVGLLAVVFVLGFTGTVDLPGFPNNDVPSVDNVPGNATHAEGVALADVERAYVTEINDRREENDTTPLERTDGLDEVATFYNQRAVKQVFGNGTLPDADRIGNLLGSECDTRATSGFTFVTQNGSTDATALGTRLAESMRQSELQPDAGATLIGVDVHAAGGDLFLSHLVCVPATA